MYLLNRHILLLILFVSLFSFGCSTNKALVRNEAQPEQQQIPPIEISEYILGFGDELEISVFRHDDLSKTVRILPDGKIYYPLVGEIKAEGLSVSQLRDKLKEGLLKYYVEPQVSVIVTSISSQKVFVLGEVNKPGAFLLDRPKTVIEAISEAEGFTQDAKIKNVLLIRGGASNPNPDYTVLDLNKTLKERDMTQNAPLRQGDIIYVPATEIADVARFFDHIWTIIPFRLALFGFRIQ
ncbi:MAG: polysaccharide biosynthesis/export family protein [Thermodesulfovibrionales bacterium]